MRLHRSAVPRLLLSLALSGGIRTARDGLVRGGSDGDGNPSSGGGGGGGGLVVVPPFFAVEAFVAPVPRRGVGARGGGTSPPALLSAAAADERDGIIDAVIEEDATSSSSSSSSSPDPSDVAYRRYEFRTVPKEVRKRKRDVVREALRDLASLSLRDYNWRSSVFKKNEAERQMEESLARMMGEDPAFVRPMDAAEGKRGPLGEAEKQLVDWLSSVIEEEGNRARRIAETDGTLVRPIESDGGPLADLERDVVSFVESIRTAERERWREGKIRPKDLEEGRRGPLGEAEARAVAALEEIGASERMRADAIRARGGEVVRPIDVPGPLGEVEMKVLDLIEAERQRAKDRETAGRLVRPMDASSQSALGDAERQAVAVFNRLKEEEKERLYNIKKVLEENRPMEADRKSLLGLTEAFAVGLLRGPQLFVKVVDRVKELMKSEKLDAEDEERLMRLAPSLNASSTEMKDVDSDLETRSTP